MARWRCEEGEKVDWLSLAVERMGLEVREQSFDVESFGEIKDMLLLREWLGVTGDLCTNCLN